ncbi:hypothetical protein CDL12_02736 [Handroanthus impetiginosus]|uniref:Uncharacterized protein n=1 Tax=Handroanthus impetiginosus TaxID=429701 RepID=A0A2G9I476_9LAMI|nr:hypothetical protein CDL12_02736 [Handroanthus impetiginosus]
MGEEDEKEPIFSSLKLPFLHIPLATMDSPEHPSGLSTPPLQTLVSVPFKWEEQPGKPRPCSDIIPLPEPVKCLELPPCRMEPANKITKTPSPTTVLDGPYNVGKPKFSSFRFLREGHDSFESCTSGSPEGLLGGSNKKGFFSKFRGGRKEFDGGSSRFSSSSFCSSDSDESCVKVKDSGGGKMRRNGSFYSFSHARPSHILATIYEGLKQVVQWKGSRKSK